MPPLPAIAVVLAAIGADAGPASRPAERPWGQAKAGVSVSVAAAGAWKLGGPMEVDFAIRNSGRVPATMPPRDELFGFLLIGQGQTAWFSERIRHAETMPDWPAMLAEGAAVALPAVDLAGLDAFVYERGMGFHEGYPTAFAGGKPAPATKAGTFGKVLKPGAVKVRYIAHLPRGAEGALQLVGPTLEMNLGLENFAGLPEPMRRKVLAEIGVRLRKDAFSAMAAHRDAVQIGKPAVEAARAVAADRSAPAFARMWAATTLADIGGPEAVAVLIGCLEDPDEGVRHVAAYHGVKLRDKGFEAALDKRAGGGEDPMLTAWAIMGYLRFRKVVPDALMAAGVESKQWKARAAVAETIARGNPDRSHLPLLRKLVADENGMIRISAARAIALVGDGSRQTVDALMTALEMEGDDARHAVATALCKVTGKTWVYSSQMSKEEREGVLRRWREWWRESRATYR
ncbi:MAG TPA: HEAT repeat domain-containing protein [Phycisphaerae bacterium]|nr:HEAT repeat domain-containing protein [Phycisphaerae bacterium]